MTKHKHYDCIVAWADGAKIEFFSPIRKIWEYTNEPSWLNNIEYRIKKEPVVEVKYYVLCESNMNYIQLNPELSLAYWSLKITYQDGKAVKVELPE